MFEQFADIFRWLGDVRRQVFEPVPELDRVAELAEGKQAKPAMVFCEDKRFATRGFNLAEAI